MSTPENTPYRVLARKYRPDSFDQLIGQDALVRTLSNALALGRLAHAFILTGVRGIGKTSTARILARGLNCEGEAGDGGPTLSPCGVCQHCKDIADSRHIDVLEMDAASNTGVDDVREIIDGANYRPVSARFKIYIIDEVHMLSRNAFNALLKTLEEPPDNVKFIFATTEIRKVPVTILSRCQRFDLRRVPHNMMTAHLSKIAEAEQISAEPAALAQIARASEGSVRDALSLLDQAAAMGADKIDETAIIDMLGQAETLQILAILKACFAGDTKTALNLFTAADAGGAEAETVIADMLDLLHEASLIAAGAAPSDLPEDHHSQLTEIADIGIAKLGRAWQLMLNGHRELKEAPNPKSAAQMILIRLAHLAPMPTPADLIKSLQTDGPSPASAPPSQQQSQINAPSVPSAERRSSNEDTIFQPERENTPAPDTALAPDTAKTPDTPLSFSSLREIAAYFEDQKEQILATRIKRHLRLVSLEDKKLDVMITGEQADDLPQELAKALSKATGAVWLVSVSETGGGPTIAEEDASADEKEKQDVTSLPLVASILDVFDGASVTSVKQLSPLQTPISDDAEENQPDEMRS